MNERLQLKQDEQEAMFRKQWRPSQVCIIQADGVDVGWLQSVASKSEHMHRSHLCSHCLRRRILLWASAFFVTIGAVGAASSAGSAGVARGQTAPAPIQTASR